MKRRFIGFLCVFILALNTTLISAVETTEEFGAEMYPDTETERAAALLSGLGIAERSAETDLNESVSRGRFVSYAAKLYNGMPANESVQYFADVPVTHSAATAVALLVKMGAISISDDRMFEPDRNITYNEAIKILVCMLEFGDLAKEKGYPTGYTIIAGRIGLTRNTDGQTMNYGVMLKLLYNTLNTVLFETEGVRYSEQETIQSRGQNDKTMLSVYFKVHGISGTVVKNDRTSIRDDDVCASGMVGIGDDVYYAEDFPSEELIGSEVTAFYKENGDDSGILICWMEEENIRTVIDKDNFSGLIDNSIRYYTEDGTKTKNISIDNYTIVVRNGVVVTEKISDAFEFDYGNIVVRENKKGDRNTVVIINACDTYCVKYVDYAEKIIYDKYDTSKKLSLSDDKVVYYRIVDVNTEAEVPVSYIVPGSILSVFESIDKSCVFIYVSTNTVNGKIDAVNSGNEVVVNGTKYMINPQTAAFCDFKPGADCIMHTDRYGRICSVEFKEGQWTIGYLYKMAVTDAFEKLKIKVFDENGKICEYVCSDSLKLNDTAIRNINSAYNAIASSGDMGTYRQLIRYKTDENNIITHIDTASDEDGAESGESLIISHSYEGADTQFYQAPASFYPAPLMDRDTKVFIVPFETDENPDDKQFVIVDKTYFTKTAKYPISAYKVDRSYPYAKVLIMRREGTAQISEQSKIMLVGDVRESINNNGEIVAVLSVLSSGVSQDLYCSSDIDVKSLGSGDVIRVGIDVENNVSEIEMVYDYSAGGMPGWGYASAEIASENCYLYANVIDKFVNTERVYDYNADKPYNVLYLASESTTKPEREMMLNCQIYVYDTERGEAYSGSFDDITPFKYSDKGSRVIIQTTWANPQAVIVYK